MGYLFFKKTVFTRFFVLCYYTIFIDITCCCYRSIHNALFTEQINIWTLMFNKKQIDKLLDDHTEEEQKETKSKVNTSFIIVFYFSILLSICTFFFDYRYFLITLFGPTILVISPPLQLKKGIYRIFSALYLILLFTVTFFWLN